MLDDLIVVRQMVDVGHRVADDDEKRIDSVAESTPTSDSMARMFRSRVDTTTVGCTSGVSWVMRAENAYGETRIRPKTLSVTSTWLQAGRQAPVLEIGELGRVDLGNPQPALSLCQHLGPPWACGRRNTSPEGDGR